MYSVGHHRRKLYISQKIGPGWLVEGRQARGACASYRGQMEGSVFSRGWEAKPGSPRNKEKAFSRARKEREGLLSARGEKLGAGAKGLGRKRGYVLLGGVRIPLGSRRRGVRGRKGGLRGYYAGTGRRPLWRVRAGMGAFSAQTPEEEADKGLE